MKNNPKRQLLKLLSHILKSKDLDREEQAELIHTTLPLLSNMHNLVLERISCERIFRALNDCGYNVEIWVTESENKIGKIRILVDYDLDIELDEIKDRGQ